MDYYMTTVELVQNPTDEVGVAEAVAEFCDLFNYSFSAEGLAVTCISVCHWDNGSPIATFLVIDAEGNASLIEGAFLAVIESLDLGDEMVVLSRAEREERSNQ